MDGYDAPPFPHRASPALPSRGGETPFDARLMISRALPAVFALFAGLLLTRASAAAGVTYYIDARAGNDDAEGTDPQRAFKSLARASRLHLRAGDAVRLAAGQTHPGSLTLAAPSGSATEPVVIGSYSPAGARTDASGADRAVIDARGQANAIKITDGRHVVVRDMVIEADGGGLPAAEARTTTMRCGVLVDTSRPGDYGAIALENLWIRRVYFEDAGFRRSPGEVRTANGTQRYGWGIRFINQTPGARLSDLTVRGSRIEMTEHTGIKFTSPVDGIRDVKVVDNVVERTGGPGIQLSGVTGGHFRGNRVDRSGDASDSRQWGRGSGLWTWSCTDILIEHNRFTNANGPGDSAGCHIDFNCRNVIVQYNVSANNAGGFCEILGNNYNCAYRYNLSVNDGHRVKGQAGAFQEGKILWLSGYVGARRDPSGPFNSYIYNNTIYTSAELVAKVAFGASARGVLIANNIFYLEGASALVGGDQNRAEHLPAAAIEPLVFSHNLFLREDNWPIAAPVRDAQPLFGDPGFARAGGLEPADYVPSNAGLVRDRGMELHPLPGDPAGLAGGLAVTHDLLGRPIVGRPDLGAIEVP